MDRWTTCSSIVFADDDDDSLSSSHSADDLTKPDTRRGILRNPSNSKTPSFYGDAPPVINPLSSTYMQRGALGGPALHAGASIFWPDRETMKQQHNHQRQVLSSSGNTTDISQTGSFARRTASWEIPEAQSAAFGRKKLTVRFLPEYEARVADDMCTAPDQFHSNIQSPRPCRRQHVGRIAECKFNDGKVPGHTSDTSAVTKKNKSGRKWYHFSFRTNKDRSRYNSEDEGRSTTVAQSIYAEPIPVQVCRQLIPVQMDVEFRCRGRREMRENDRSNYVNYADGGFAETQTAQGYRPLPASVSDSENVAGHELQSSGERRSQNWSQRELSSSSVDLRCSPDVSDIGQQSSQGWSQRELSSSSVDLRRSPNVSDIGQQSNSAVRRSRSSVGEERRRQGKHLPASEMPPLPLPARRNSVDLTLSSSPTSSGPVPVPLSRTGARLTETDLNPGLEWHSELYKERNGRPSATCYEVRRRVSQQNVEPKDDEKSDAVHHDSRTTTSHTLDGRPSLTLTTQLRTLTDPVEEPADRLAPTEEEGVAQAGTSDAAFNSILQRSSIPAAPRQYSSQWTMQTAQGVRDRVLPEIRVTPATDERRRRRPPTPVKQSTTTSHTQQRRPRDYTAIYAWSPQLPNSTVTSMKRSATFGDEPNLIRSDSNGYIEPAGHRGVKKIDHRNRSCFTADPDLTDPQGFVRTNCCYGRDFVDMRGVCRAVISSADLLQIEMFYRSNKTEVFPCACAARLHLASVRRHSTTAGSRPEVPDAMRWYPTTAVGVPVIVLDCGGSRCRDRKLNLVLAEVGSGFALWRDAVDHLTGYRALTSDFHALWFSRDHSRLAGLRFTDAAAAAAFRRQLQFITSGPTGDSLLNLCTDKRAAKHADRCTVPKSCNHAMSTQKTSVLRPQLKKCDISAPCCFEHITKFEPVQGFLV